MQELEKIHEHRLVPVVAIHNADHAAPLADALVAGGLPVAEVTFRTEAALQAMQIMGKNPDILLGAGTVLSVEQVKMAVDVGARYIVSPGFNEKVVDYCCKNNIAVTPGVATPTEIEMALGHGLEVVKFFPAEAFGGLKSLKAISAPYTMMKFIPTGGISSTNLEEYLLFPKIWACGGSWMVKSDMIAAEKFDEIENLTNQAVTIVKNILKK